MQKKINSIWVYTIILFSIALTLILMSALAQVNLTPDDAENISETERLLLSSQTAQQTSVLLAEENEQVRDDYARLEDQYTVLQERAAAYEEIIMLIGSENIDTSALSEAAAQCYEDLVERTKIDD